MIARTDARVAEVTFLTYHCTNARIAQDVAEISTLASGLHLTSPRTTHAVAASDRGPSGAPER